MPEDGKKDDDRNRNAQQPKQNTATHSYLLIDTGNVNAFVRVWLREGEKRPFNGSFLRDGVSGRPAGEPYFPARKPDLAGTRPALLRHGGAINTLALRIQEAEFHRSGLHGCFRSAARGQ
jgi:hypothetical protein